MKVQERARTISFLLRVGEGSLPENCGNNLTGRLEERFEMGAGVERPEEAKRTLLGKAPLAKVGRLVGWVDTTLWYS